MASRSDIEAGNAFLRLFLKDDMTKALSRSLSNVGKSLSSAGKQVAAVGAGVAAAGSAMLAPLVGAVSHFAAFGDQLDKMSKRTGIAAPALAEFGFAAEQSGTNLEKVENAIRKMQKTIGDADRGLSTAVDGLDALGLSAAKLEGMSPEDQFQLISDRLRTIEDPTKRAAAAMEVFGSRTGTALLPMLDELKELREEARDLGIVPSEKQVEDAAKVTDALNRIKRSVGAVAFEIGASLADSVLDLAESAKKIIQTVRVWVKENIGLVKTFAAVAVGLIAAGTAISILGSGLIFAGFALQGLAAIVGLLGSALAFVLSPIGLLTAALVGGVVAWARYTESGKSAVSAIRDRFGELFTIAKETIGGISDALMAGDIALAGQIAFAGLKIAALKALDAISGLIGETLTVIAGQILSGDLSGAWATTVDSMTSMWMTFNEGLVSITTGMADSIIGVWEKVVTFIAQKIIDVASLPGFNTLFKFVSGVDLRHEIKRGKKLGNNDPLGQAKQFASDDITGQADAARALNEQARSDARQRNDEAAKALAGNVAEGMSDLMFGTILAEGELAALTAKAKKAKDAAAKGGSKSKGEGGEGETTAGIVGGMKNLVTFSAEAAIAAGFQSRSPEMRMLSETEKARKEAHEDAMKLIESDEKIIKAVEGIGLGLVHG